MAPDGMDGTGRHRMAWMAPDGTGWHRMAWMAPENRKPANANSLIYNEFAICGGATELFNAPFYTPPTHF